MLIRICILLLCAAPALAAQLRLPNAFSDHMVLQRDKALVIWGWGRPNSELSVRFADQEVTGHVDAQGKFKLKLEAEAASFIGRDLVLKSGDESITVRDVLVGEVWLCGGQSNMAWTLRASRDADVEIASARDTSIRFLRVPLIARAEPQDDFPVQKRGEHEGNWRIATTGAVEHCTAVGYYFARRLRRRLDVPIGLIDTSWGGTMAQHWVSKPTLRKIPEVSSYFEEYEARHSAWVSGGREEGAESRYQADLAAWKKELASAEDSGSRKPRKPRQDAYGNPADKGHPGAMMNGMIYPLAQVAMRGVIFYQGENNSFSVSWKPFYRTFPAVISDWRRILGDESLPFGLVQIAGWSNRRSMTYDMNHHCNVVREIQFDTWRETPGTGLIVTFDTNSNGSIHPGRKLPVGGRCARWALSEVYRVPGRGKTPLEWCGPTYKSMQVDSKKIVISFDPETSKGMRLDQDVDVGFYIAGEDQVWRHARARVNGSKSQVIVWSDDVPAPVAVRYGWSNLPAGGLMNGRELPAFPFRTDAWPMTPHQSTGSYTR